MSLPQPPSAAMRPEEGLRRLSNGFGSSDPENEAWLEAYIDEEVQQFLFHLNFP
jgi:hypothetical protein